MAWNDATISTRTGTTDSSIGRGKNTWPSIFQGSRKQSFSLHQSPFSVACNAAEMSETKFLLPRSSPRLTVQDKLHSAIDLWLAQLNLDKSKSTSPLRQVLSINPPAGPGGIGELVLHSLPLTGCWLPVSSLRGENSRQPVCDPVGKSFRPDCPECQQPGSKTCAFSGTEPR